MNHRSCYQQVSMALGLLLAFTGGLATKLSADHKRLQTIEGSMSLEYSPCYNFFDYACKNWETQRNGSFATHTMEMLEERVEEDFLKFFEQTQSVSVTEPKFLVEMSKYYEACLDTGKTKDTHPWDYIKWLSVYESISFPMYEGNDAQFQWHWDWIEMLATLRRYGFNDIIVHVDIVQRKDDPRQMVIELKRPSLASLHEIFVSEEYPGKRNIDKETVDALQKFQDEMVLKTAEYVRDEDDFDFGRFLATKGDVDDSKTTLISLKDLQMPWIEKYLEVLLNQTAVDPRMQISVESVKYLTMIYDLVNKYDNGLVCDYIQFKFMMFVMEHNHYGSKWQCMDGMRSHFPLAMQWIYKSMHPELRQEFAPLEALFENLKSTYKADIQANSFSYTDAILDYLEAKVDQLQLHIFDISTEQLDTYYQHLHLSSTDHWGNFLRLLQFKFSVASSALGKTLTRHSVEFLDLKRDTLYEYTSDKVIHYNLPYFYARLNTVFLPLTMLGIPFHAHGWSDVYTYSTLGFHLALEIKRAFDPRHLIFDADGIRNSAMYEEILKNPDYEKFNEKMEHDFHKFRAVVEAANDIGALQLAYDTFADLHPDLLKQQIAMPQNSSMTTTLEQVFFLNYAQSFCTFSCIISPINYDFFNVCQRVSGSVRSLHQFSQAFQCK